MPTGIGIGISPFIGRRFSWAAWWATHLFGQDDLNLWAKDRSGLTMPDTIGTNDVTILTPTFKCTHPTVGNLTGSGGALERIFDGNSYTIYFKLKQVDDVVANIKILDLGHQYVTNRRGLELRVVLSVLKLYMSIGDGAQEYAAANMNGVNTDVKDAGWLEFFIEIDFAAKEFRSNIFKYSDGSAIGISLTKDISTYIFNDDDNYSPMMLAGTGIAYGDLKKFNALKTIAQCRDNSYITDIQFYYPTLEDGTDINNAHHLTRGTNMSYPNKYYSNISTYCLDYGYSIYRSRWKDSLFPASVGYEDIYVPHNPSGVAIARTINDNYPSAYIKIGEFAGSLTNHNMSESKLNIPIASWDKADTNIFEDTVRSSIYYNATNTDEWHISELDYLLFSQRSKTGYKGLNFFKITDNSLASEDRLFLKELFSYGNDKTGNNLNKILQYTGDYSAINTAIKLISIATPNATITIRIGGITGEDSLQIYWGDGIKKEIMLMNDTRYEISHTYVGYSFPIYILNPENLSTILLGDGASPQDTDIVEIGKAVNLKSFWTSGSFVGSINHLPITITDLRLGENNLSGIQFITGSIVKFVNLTRCDLFGDNTVSGAMNAPNIERVFFAGMSSASLNINGLTGIVRIEKTNSGGGNYMNGSLNTSLGFEMVCVDNPNDITADFDLLPESRYLSSSNIEVGAYIGSVNNMPELFELIFTRADLTGNIANCPNFQIYSGGCPNLTKPTRFNAIPKLISFTPNTDWVWSSAEVNQLLADLWANRDIAKTNDLLINHDSLRCIKLNTVGTGAPTGQGLTDLANLRAYRSPGNDPAYALWTIDVNS